MECGLTNPARAGMQQRQFALHPPWSPWHRFTFIRAKLSESKMSYQVIARKYRPQRFSDVVGQEHVTQTLANAINQKRIAHAYLFVGPRGTGKTTIARIFAKCLNCTDGPKAEFSDTDPKCIEITEGRSMDVLEIDGASNRGIEDIRDLRDTVRYAPASSKFKIYIIDEVHMLTKEAFNALLKTLEEPPEHVKFMFATTEPEKVLPTILSRCQRFDLRRIPSSLIVKHLAQIAGLEKVKIDPAALEAIARGAEGGMRDAESTLDQLISFCGDNIEESDVLSMFGLAAQGRLIDLAAHVLSGDAEACLNELNDMARQGKDLTRLLTDLLGHFRNLLVFKVSKGDLRLLEVSEAEAASLKDQSQNATAETLTRILEVFTECEMRLRDAASKKTLIEVALLKAIEARRTMSLDDVLQQLRALRAGSTPASNFSLPIAPASPAANPPPLTSATKTVAAKPAATTTYAPAVPAMAVEPIIEEAPTSGVDAGSMDLLTLWPKLLEAIGRVSQFTKSYLVEAHPVSMTKKLLTIGFDSTFADHIALVDHSKNHDLIHTKLNEMGYPGVQIKFVKADRPTDFHLYTVGTPTTVVPEQKPEPVKNGKPVTVATQAAPPKQSAAPAMEIPAVVAFNKDDFKNDPLIQKALEIFKGHIVEVRS